MTGNISLIGYRGTGKTTVGQRLAARIGYVWVDTDATVEQRAGLSIADIFTEQGETAFRDIESGVVSEFTAQKGLVLSLGGGVVLREANRQRICASGPVVWLQAEAATILRRLRGDPSTASRRPNLRSDGGLQEIEELLAQRAPLYQECATLIVDTEDRSADELVDLILADHRLRL